MDHPGAIARDFPAVYRSINPARATAAALAEQVGAGADIVEDIRLAVSEAATNVVRHAYHGQRPGRMRILAVAGGDDYVVVIEDDGDGLDVPSGNSGLGVGLKLMEEVAEEMILQRRTSGGCAVQMRFSLTR